MMKPEHFSEWAGRVVQAIKKCQHDEATTSTWDLSLWEFQDDNRTLPCLFHPSVFENYKKAVDDDSKGDREENEVALEDEDIIPDEQAIALPQEFTTMEEKRIRVQWNFSIVYSDTYGVPVLYFRVQTLDGSPCERSRILEWLPDQSIDDSWDFISQEEHPINGLPSYFLHPCQTSSRLKDLLQSTSQNASILWAWMSMIFPAVNHPIPPSFYRDIRSELDES
ncbi:unnamed protein product [Cylindrotheca closterium]|uniref:Ubiquitin-like-conjugating enzyme ATG10 n=1 Tax=Cylindrotheca closterium TaxID=2856 RepID=A0AAD2GCR0_9STRA|nr:unnamed protein product [Cylindrotheca closterium]